MRGRGERGLATVWAVTLVSVLSMVTFAVAGMTALVGSRHRAEAAADLAALAGAVAARDGGDPCAAAAEVARANDGTLRACSRSGAEVQVTVSVRGPELLGVSRDLTGVARAGPAGPAASAGSLPGE